MISIIDRPMRIVTECQAMGQGVEEKATGQLLLKKGEGFREHTGLLIDKCQ